MIVTLLHPGQMGAAVGAQAVAGGATVYWCPTNRSEATATRADQAGLQPRNDLGQLLTRTDLVISLCPPAVAEDLAHHVAGLGYQGPYVDANAISPQRCARIAKLFRAGTFLDATVIGPPPSTTTTARLYVGGPPDISHQLAETFTGTSVQVKPLSDRPGDASALKMAFASYQKASRTLAAVAHALAADYGLRDTLLAEAQKFTTSPLADPDYIPSVAARAWRWAPEMNEIADTLEQTGLPSSLARATAETLHRWHHDKDNHDLTTTDALKHLHHP